MASLVIMPRQGQSVESCIISEWKVKVGDTVAEGDVLFTYETDKSSFEEKAKEAGTVLAIFRADGDDVPCLDPVCVIGASGEDYSSLVPAEGGAEAKPEAEVKAEAPKAEAAPTAAAPAIATATAPKLDVSLSFCVVVLLHPVCDVCDWLTDVFFPIASA